MSWIEFSGPKKITAFAALALLSLVFLCFLPADAWLRRGWGGRAGLPFPLIVVVLWIGGWFVGFFLRAQDPYVTLGYDYGRLYRRCGFAGAALGFVGAILLASRYWVP